MSLLLRRAYPLLMLSITVLFLLSACGSSTASGNSNSNGSSSSTISVVAAENFYGDVVKQLGGSHVSVKSILSDPNVDPPKYDPTVHNPKKFSNAHLLIE